MQQNLSQDSIQLTVMFKKEKRKIGESKLCPPVAAVVGAVRRYKEMKNRQEPFTLGMLHLLLLKLHFILLDSYKYALSDWKCVGLLTSQMVPGTMPRRSRPRRKKSKK